MLLHSDKGTFMLREAHPTDLPALLFIHVTSWNATYPDYFPKPTVALREQQWKKLFEERDHNWTCFVAVHERGEIAGLVTCHDFQDDNLPYKGQLDKIHILQSYQRLGIGHMLVGAVVRHFLQRGIDTMILFADPANPAIRFYDLLGGERVNKKGQFDGPFCWKDIRILQEACRKM